MTNVQVRNVPDDVLTRLKKRAAARGQSLQGYLRDLLAAEAAVEVNNEILARARARLTGLPESDGDDVVEMIRKGREERDQALGIAE